MRITRWSILILILLQFPSINLISQNYPLNEVSNNLIDNSKIVIRSYTKEIEVKSKKDVVEKTKLVLTILNENGLEDADLVRFYNKFITIKKLKATLYDKEGRKIKTLDRDHFRDFSAVSNNSLFEDSRVKYVDCDYATTPFTIEYSWETNHSGIIGYNDWMPVWDYNIALEKSELILISENLFEIRHLETGAFNFESQNTDNKIIRKWTLNDFPAIEEEVFSPPKKMIFPVVRISPVEFEIDDYSGNLNTWEEFGLWIKKLNDDQSEFSDDAKNEILAQIDGISNRNEIITHLYTYLQNKTRYVNISIGIGGWQPLSPQLVHDKSYGDCKALTHYMKTILDIAGINSYYTIIRAGSNSMPIITNFPSNQFNHAILCVPIDGDTTWLECTNPYTPPGYVSTFIDDRDALLINESGGQLVHTSSGKADSHVKKNINIVEITQDLNGIIQTEQSYSGYFYDKNQMLLHGDAVDIKKYIFQNIRISDFKLIDYSVEEKREVPPIILKKLNIKKNDILENVGSRYILDLNVLKEVVRNNFTNPNRYADVLVRRNLNEIDSTIFIIPESFEISYIPEPVLLKSEFGTFVSEISVNNNQILLYQKLFLKKGLYPADQFQNLSTFLETVYDQHNQKCILKAKSR